LGTIVVDRGAHINIGRACANSAARAQNRCHISEIMLLDVMFATEADTEDIMRFCPVPALAVERR
jgi:N-acetylglucosamine kinase-like BadF-type ATPase